MKFKKTLLIMIISVLLTFTSCTGIFADPSTLVIPPKAEGNLRGIEQALNDAIGKNYNFKYPLSGEFISPCITKDLNNDGIDEAIVFYTLKSDASIIYLNLLCKNEDKWVSTSNIQVVGTDINRVEFADLLGDGNLEILISSRMFDSKLYDLNESKLSIYTLTKQKLKLHTQENHTEFHVCNLTGGEKPQILLLNIRTENLEESYKILSENKINAKLISLNEDGLTVLGIANLDKDITEFSLIQTAPLNEDINGVYIDAYKGAGIMITELLYFKNGLVNVFYDKNISETTLTRREGFINCRDINNDGYIEIPVTHIVKGFENISNKEERALHIVWRRYNGNIFENVFDGLINTADGYFLITPKNWFSNVTVTRYNDERMRVISLWDFKNGTAGDELVKIKVFSKETWNSHTGNINGFTLITSNDCDVFAAAVNEDLESNYKITIQYLKENLIIF